jgi:ribosomal small subunit protein bTHX
MGRGDNRTKRGKISTGSYGVSRPAKAKKANAAKAAGKQDKQ